MDKTTGQFDIITHHVIDKIPRYFKKLTCYLNMIVYRFKKITRYVPGREVNTVYGQDNMKI